MSSNNHPKDDLSEPEDSPNETTHERRSRTPKSKRARQAEVNALQQRASQRRLSVRRASLSRLEKRASVRDVLAGGSASHPSTSGSRNTKRSRQSNQLNQKQPLSKKGENIHKSHQSKAKKADPRRNSQASRKSDNFRKNESNKSKAENGKVKSNKKSKKMGTKSVKSRKSQQVLRPHPSGHAVQILKFDEDRKFALDIEALGEILLNDVVRRSPLVILSIAGDFRKGKSFLLNHFLEFFCQDCNTTKWLQDLEAPLRGFSWRGGSERDTSGILMWSQPFIVKDNNNRDLAVILMDTQGSFDNEFTFKDSALVFALSTMTSSIQVFNLMHNLQDDDLQVLEFFSEYGRLAMEAVDEKPFQKLMFLIRDWPYPYEHPYGFQGGEAFLEKKLTLNENMPEELQRARKRICECFQDIGCFLMPHPGQVVASQADYDGRAKGYDPEFLMLLREFVPNLLHPSRLITKKIAGKEVTGWEMMEYFKTYSDIFQSDDMPEPKNLFDATAEANNLTAMKISLDLYMKKMAKICAGRNYINPPRLMDFHNRVQNECLEQFDDTLKIGGAEYAEKYREKLFVDIEDAFEQFQNQNKCKNFFGVFGTPFIILIFSIKFYTLSSIFQMFGAENYSRMANSFCIALLTCALSYIALLYNGSYPELLVLMDTIAEGIWQFVDHYVIAKLLHGHDNNNTQQQRPVSIERVDDRASMRTRRRRAVRSRVPDED